MKKHSKKYAFLLVAASLGSTSVMAQTNVTVYGLVDTSIRYVSSYNAAGNSNVLMTNGAISNSRWGMSGIEDLGGGSQAIFRLEGGFSSDTGAMSDSNSLFNRYSYVGLKNDYGQLTLGRQQTSLSDLMADHFDPLTVGNYDLNSWLPGGATLIRNSNSIKYYGTFGAIAAGMSVALGEQPGRVRQGQQISTSLQYTTGPLSFGGGYQQTSSAVDTRQDETYNVSASYILGAAKLFGGYYRINDSSGTTPSYFGATNSVAANNGGTVGVERHDNGFFFGSSYKASPAWTLTGAAYYDKSSNVTIRRLGNLGNGTRYALIAVAEYALSKRTQVYTTVDYNKASGAALSELAGSNSVTGVAAGIRHIF